MNSLICPISKETVNKSVVRTTGFLVALTIILYAATSNIFLIYGLFIDFTIRAFTPLRFSPLSFIACKIVQLLKLQPTMIGKAPKIFAARVGFIFTIAIVLLYYISPLTSLIVALSLMSFALLESLFNFCVGCVVYTYVILPLNK